MRLHLLHLLLRELHLPRLRVLPLRLHVRVLRLRLVVLRLHLRALLLVHLRDLRHLRLELRERRLLLLLLLLAGLPTPRRLCASQRLRLRDLGRLRLRHLRSLPWLPCAPPRGRDGVLGALRDRPNDRRAAVVPVHLHVLLHVKPLLLG